MINFFGTNEVPNGYIYTSHKGSEYIYFEGIWFNHKNLKMIEPSKTNAMNEAAKKQIREHNNNSTNKMIGESYVRDGRSLMYVGRGVFTEDGVIVESEQISEVIMDEERVYEVSRETQSKEWNELGFYLLPPYAEDMTIPAGLVVNGYRFSPRNQRFVHSSTGQTPEAEFARELYRNGVRLANHLKTSAQNSVVPVGSTLQTKKTKEPLTWNGTEFCDLTGQAVIPAEESQRIISQYKSFVQKNPKLFPELTGQSAEEEEREVKANELTAQRDHREQKAQMKAPDHVSEMVTEADEPGKAKITPPEGVVIPNGYKYFDYNYRNGKWYERNQEVDAAHAAQISAVARKEIKKHNDVPDLIPIGSKVEIDGQEYTYTGENLVNSKGQLVSKDLVTKVDDQYEEEYREKKAKESGQSERSSEPEEEVVSTESITEAPNGFVITSKAGVQYFKKNGQWISRQTKKPMNSSAAKSIERAAITKIEEFNKTSPIKIGQKWTSSKGKEYTYVGDDRLISDDGKMVPKDAAVKAIQSMSAGAGAASAETDVTDAAKDIEQDAKDVEQDVQQDVETVQNDSEKEKSSTEDSAEADANPLQALADEIKASPLARKITVLLTRGDKVSIMAADILLSGTKEDAIKVLKALNSNDE